MKRNDFSPSRRWVLAGLMTGVADCALANAPTRSLYPLPRPGGASTEVSKARRAPSVTQLIADANLGGKVTFVVADAKTGEVLEAHKPLYPMPPASVTKSLTALYGLSALGADHRFRTCLIATGPIEDGTLKGDLVLVGTGDPTLDTDGLADLASQMKANGIHAVQGRFLTYGSRLPHLRLIDPDQPDHVGYNPSISGLNLNFNRVHFEWKRAGEGYSMAMDARTAKYRPAVSVARISVADRKGPVYTYNDLGGTDDWTVARSALGQGGSRWLPVRYPDAYCADVFRTLARSHGITLTKADPASDAPSGEMLAEWTSPRLEEILRGMLKYSTNLTAEVVGLAASLARGAPQDSLRASGGQMTDWLSEKTRINKVRFVDHSGLGDQSRISASEMVGALVRLGPDAGLRPLLKQVPMLDQKGNRVDNHPAKIRAKTGTLNFVSALAGYIEAPDGTDLVFAIFCADLDRRAKLTKAERERPEGGKSWTRRARRLHGQLIARWTAVYGA
ncbi:D-alanyl-D-alanine carboxypeptidase/D-alanyl-D-alanine-endopeptidase [Actibacterium sp. 188UL27-1]|uniref:D-alanyl-D-alanine carboxypeptidase/D-alanyl-D-alanine endopeptidase n=1 Tax=Actibacterium sp. 188UL27-1 TaxID=2786961 RepID=UPI0019590EEB|nr:D-alanyl-D-alanine carboxypeptidase/D-alanyl-D-alanine-endopeptidase [Actibacterium sp. 188UL27-1]MBM7067361.1 D-alanyl-D-alanine carboxypeptidase/D-alanyl-D-alanine-endopeptidase [Actibacterium sp. 188UL27-1]